MRASPVDRGSGLELAQCQTRRIYDRNVALRGGGRPCVVHRRWPMRVRAVRIRRTGDVRGITNGRQS
ncbi:hypothetical protein SSAG_02759 [Streptomyces sp. Mg1]|nr:hypothetical protein SSAG_02759 [Streptomyces sp. Mg1]